MANKIIKIKTSKIRSDGKNTYSDISIISAHKPALLSTGKYKIDKNIDIKAVKNAILNIFTWLPGERILDPEFGNNIYQYIYDGINKYNIEQITSEIKTMLFRYEPRVTVDDIQYIKSNDDIDDNTINLKIIYHINGLPSNIFQDFIVI